jgi:zinc protease
MKTRAHRRAVQLSSAGFLLSCLASTPSAATAPAAATPTPVATPPATPAAPSADAILALDPRVRTGTLANGLRYFVRANAQPRQRAELWLAIDAGSVQEDDDQRGLAHFLEHMAFNGTKRFPKNDLIGFLERLGIRFGADLNASTSFDETTYTLTVPTDDPQLLDKAFDVLEDWAGAITLDPAQVEAEKGVVIEEWRLGRGAAARIRDRQLPILWKDSLYARRLPIGDKAILEAATPELLRRFRDDWYRPDLMSVIAVGDFDAAAIETKIRERFARLQAKSKRPRVSPPVPPSRELAVDVAADPELTVASASISLRGPAESTRTVADYRRVLSRSLWNSIVRYRLDELRRLPDPPFLSAFVGGGGSLRTSSSFDVRVTADPARLAAALRTTVTEVERARRAGVTAGEFERARSGFLRFLDSRYAERDQIESADLASELSDYALEREAMPGIEAETALAREILASLTVADLNAADGPGAVFRLDGEQAPVVLASGPRKDGVTLPEPAALTAVLDGLAQLELEPYVDRVADTPLVPVPPAGGKVVEATTIAELGVLDWRLSNGTRVLVKPTDFKADEVSLSGFRPGGTSNASDADFLSASFATAALGEGGLGTFDAVTLRKFMSGKIAGAAPVISELEEGVSAFASPRDIETMFELTYLALTAPREDPQAFASYRERSKKFLQNRLLQPQAVFQDELTRVMSQNHPRRQPATPETLDGVDLATSGRFFRSRFADVGGMTFVVVGAVDEKTLRPLVERWLGGLPSAGGRSNYRDVGVEAPQGQKAVLVKKGLEPKALVSRIFHGDAAFSREATHDARSLADALRIELREVLREDDGGVYGVSVSASLADRPRPRRTASVSFGCDPKRVDALLGELDRVLERFRKEGPKAETVVKVRETQRREREVALRENDFWSGVLANYLSRGWDPRLILRYDELLERVTVERIRDTAKAMLDPSRSVLAELLPEG